ncbi:MAG: hypothetical protein LBP59_04945 [Planctomycetaceae bacterium]|jgi:hypothetical protein|nr:hypothetical protein [Planctomycetaceae bacterium]
MTTFFLICFVLIFLLILALLFCFNLLLLRLGVIDDQIVNLRSESGGQFTDQELVKLLRRILVDADLSSELGNRGLETPLRKPLYEPANEQTNTFLALVRLISNLPREGVDDQLKRIAALFLLQFKLGLDAEIFMRSISQIISRLKNQSYHGAKIAEIRTPLIGDAIDLSWMFPCSVPAGFRVKSPLGVGLFDETGKLIAKANVIGK